MLATAARTGLARAPAAGLRALSSRVHVPEQEIALTADATRKLRQEYHVNVTPLSDVHGHRVVREIGMVTAAAVRSRSLLSDVAMALKGAFGGEAPSYSRLLNETTAEAMERLAMAAKSQGATSVVRVRFQTNLAMNRLVFGLHTSVLCYGMAVVDKPSPSPSTGMPRAADLEMTGGAGAGRA